MNHRSTRLGQSAAQKARQNWLRSLLLSALSAIALALIPSAASAQNTAPPTAATASQTIAAIRTQMNELGQRVSIAPCRPDQYRVGIDVPVPGGSAGQTVQVPACITTDHPPCEAELQGVRRIFIEQRTQEVRQRIAIALIQRRVRVIEQRVTTIEQTNLRQDADLAALEVIDAQTLAYVQQLGGPWADSVVEAINNLNGWITTINGQIAQLRTDLTAETARATNAENTERDQRTAADQEHDRQLAAGRRHRLTLGPYAGFTRLAGPQPGPAWNAGHVGISLMGRPWDAPVVIGTRLTMAYGDTEGPQNRGAFGFFLEPMAGYEWGFGRVMAGATAGMLVSSRWRETIFTMGIGPIGRVELNPHRSVAVGFSVAGLFGNAVDPNTGRSYDTSRYVLTLDVGFHLGNW